MNHSVINLTVPERFYSNEQLSQIISKELQKNKQDKKSKVIHKDEIITPEKFLNSKMMKRLWL